MNRNSVGLIFLLPVAALVPAAGSGWSGFDSGPPAVPAVNPFLRAPVCEPGTTGPDYYRIPLVSTKRVVGSHYARGTAEVYHADSPFGVTVATDGSYVRRLEIAIDGLQPAVDGSYVAWVTTPALDEVELLGTLEEPHRLGGLVPWNKFLVVISLEADPRSLGSKWSGPIEMRGMSKSGAMHTMAGHGPYETENCAAYGFD